MSYIINQSVHSLSEQTKQVAFSYHSGKGTCVNVNFAPSPLLVGVDFVYRQRTLLSGSAALPPVQLLVPGDDGFVEFDHERGALVPVRCDFGGEAAVSEEGLHHASGEGGAVQRAVLFRHGYERVHQRLLLDDVVRLVVVVGLLQLVCFLTEQRLPHGHLQTTHKSNTSYLTGYVTAFAPCVVHFTYNIYLVSYRTPILVTKSHFLKGFLSIAIAFYNF